MSADIRRWDGWENVVSSQCVFRERNQAREARSLNYWKTATLRIVNSSPIIRANLIRRSVSMTSGADCENQIGEVKREGLSAIPTRRFMNNYAYFQIVLLAYNVWRSFKMLAEYSERQNKAKVNISPTGLSGIADNTIRIARLKLLLIAAKLVTMGNTTKVRYSEHTSRVAGLFSFMEHLDRVRMRVRPWFDSSQWQCWHMEVLRLRPAENSS